jgi:hypothetical protein
MATKKVNEKVNPNFGMVWDPKTGRFFQAVGSSKNKEGGVNKGRFKGGYGMAGKTKNTNFTGESVEKTVTEGLIPFTNAPAVRASAQHMFKLVKDGVTNMDAEQAKLVMVEMLRAWLSLNVIVNAGKDMSSVKALATKMADTAGLSY